MAFEKRIGMDRLKRHLFYKRKVSANLLYIQVPPCACPKKAEYQMQQSATKHEYIMRKWTKHD